MPFQLYTEKSEYKANQNVINLFVFEYTQLCHRGILILSRHGIKEM